MVYCLGNGVQFNRTIFMTAVLKEELKHWLKRLEMDEAVDPERYRNSGMLLRLPNGLAVEPTISVSALLELLKDADPAVKAQLRLALLT